MLVLDIALSLLMWVEGDNQLCLEEFSSALHSLELGLTDKQIKELLSLIDKDKSGTINYSEFMQQFGVRRIRSQTNLS